MNPVIYQYASQAQATSQAAERAEAMRQKLNRLARAQALAWQALTASQQRAYLADVDRMEGK